jgi:carboxypeptidase family protein
MFEKLYTSLFRLYPSRFRKEYEAESLQLIRDRLRDETGTLKRARLLWDLATDFLVGLPQAHRNSYTPAQTQALSLHAGGIPSFKMLDEQPMGPKPILLGGTLSLAAIVAFAFLLSRSMAHLPVLGANGRMSPIEAVVDRLNRAAASDTPLTESEKMAETIAWRGALADGSGRPVRSAEIHLIGGHGELVARTGADGSFAFSEVPPGNYELAVVLDGREIAYRNSLHVSAVSSPSRLTLASGGRLLVSQPGKLP